jgi:putative membrane protein insertion efficiency factor
MLIQISIFLLKGYQRFFSAFVHLLAGPGFGCRFTPSCSEYTVLAIQKQGIIRGSFTGLVRILKCHPFSRGGADPI